MRARRGRQVPPSLNLSLAHGARFLKRVIESRIKLPISQRWNEGRDFTLDVQDGRLQLAVAHADSRLALAATA